MIRPRIANGAEAEMDQQVDVQASLTLSLPAAWSKDEIADHIRTRLDAAFANDFPAGMDQHRSTFTLQEEAEIYGNRETPRRGRRRAWPVYDRKKPARKR
jgi:hypothetical protein